MNDSRTSTPLPARQATAREFLAVLFRRKWIILGLFIITTVTVAIMSFATPVTYSSVARVLIKRGERESAMQPNRRISDWKEDLSSEMEVVRSVPVANATQSILDQRAGSGGTRFRFNSGKVQVQIVGQSNVMLIAYDDRDAAVAHQACDALVTAYVQYRLQSLSLSYPKEFFDAEIERVTKELSRWENLRRNFTNRAGVSDPGMQRNYLIGYQMLLKGRFEDLSGQLAEARAQRRVIGELSRDPEVDLPMIGPQYGNEQVVVEIKRKLLDQESRLTQLRERYRDDAPEVTTAQTTLDALRAMLKREVDSRQKMSDSRVGVLESRLEPMRRELADVEAQIAAIPNKEMTLSEMDREISVLKARYNEIFANSDRARITEQTSSQVWIIVLAPAGPAQPSKARDYVRLALAPAFSLVVGLALAFFVDGLDSRVRTPLDVENALDVPVLASIANRRRTG